MNLIDFSGSTRVDREPHVGTECRLQQRSVFKDLSIGLSDLPRLSIILRWSFNHDTRHRVRIRLRGKRPFAAILSTRCNAGRVPVQD